jgi:hypothetical protein
MKALPFVVLSLLAPAALAQVDPVRSSVESSALVELNGVEISDLQEDSDSQAATVNPLGIVSVDAFLKTADGEFDSTASGEAIFNDTRSGVFNASGRFEGTQTNANPDATTFLHAVRSTFQYDFFAEESGSIMITGSISNGGPLATSFIGDVRLFKERAPGEGFTDAATTSVFDFDGSGSEFQIARNLNGATGNYRLEIVFDHIGFGALDTSESSGSISASFDIRLDCAADFTNDGTLDVFDVFAFLDAFQAMDDAADFTGDGAFDIFDVFAYLDAFNAGCP